MRLLRIGLISLLTVSWLVTPRPAAAGPNCHLFLVQQASSTQGFALSVKNGTAGCPLSLANLVLLVGSNSVVVSEAWQPKTVYTVQVVLRGGGPQDVYLDGVWMGSAPGHFLPAPGPVIGSYDAADDSGAEYVVRQLSLSIVNGSNVLSLQPNNGKPVPLPVITIAGGPAPWPAQFTIDPTQTTTVTVTFRFDVPEPFDSSKTDKQYFDRYGQAVAASWDGKILDATAAEQLQAAAVTEQAWLAANPPASGLDPFGGSTVAGWTSAATGYFHTAFHAGRWWMISPQGNPLFYIGITGVFPYTTPITNREDLFADLPSPSGAYAAAYSTSANSVTYYSSALANEILKYCGGAACDVEHIQNQLEQQRLPSWGFLGVGKFAHTPSHFPAVPVLEHEPAKVPAGVTGVTDVVSGGHPDVFDVKTLGDLRSTLDAQIGTDKTNPYIVGWSVGNEKAELVTADEIGQMVLLGPSVPAKKALVDYALLALYGGNIGRMSKAWGSTGGGLAGLYAAQPTSLSTVEVEKLREFYEGAYYFALRVLVKSIDPHHLYFGGWIPTGDANLPIDWGIAAAICDVVGFDDFTAGPLSDDFLKLVHATNKPVLLGAFGFPADYGGARGFGWSRYTNAMTLTDADSGEAYAQRLSSAAADPFVVGAMIFDYHDEPLSGRGAGGDADTARVLVNEEDFAFGLLDVTDTPKYSLLDKVRATNFSVLRALGLIGGV